MRREEANDVVTDEARDVVAAENSVRVPIESMESFSDLLGGNGPPLMLVPPDDCGLTIGLCSDDTDAGLIGLTGLIGAIWLACGSSTVYVLLAAEFTWDSAESSECLGFDL